MATSDQTFDARRRFVHRAGLFVASMVMPGLTWDTALAKGGDGGGGGADLGDRTDSMQIDQGRRLEKSLTIGSHGIAAPRS